MDGRFWWWADDGPMPRPGSTSCWPAGGVPFIVVFLNKVDLVDDRNSSSWWNWSCGTAVQIRFSRDDIPIIRAAL